MGYLGTIVAKDSDAFVLVLRSLDPGMVAGALLAALAMMLLKALYHYDLCRSLGGGGMGAEVILRAYATAQVVRYLPGKVWGLLYQAALLSDMGPGRVVTANLMQMVHTNLLAIGVISAVLGSVSTERAWPLWALAVSLLLVELLHRRPKLEAVVVTAANRMLRRSESATFAAAPRPWRGTIILVLEWLVYYAMWWALLAPIGFVDMLVPSTWYAAASLLAILAFVVPGGIGVREALFVTLAAGFTGGGGSLVAIAAGIRLVLLAAELACIPVASLLGRWIDRSTR
jgi:uncharacterized membrane protein YbhN (UPF0104 family)